jgi:Trk K+ transport system NAD-binding subunit
MKYIICGLEHIGLRVIESLSELNSEITLITLNRNEPDIFFIKDKLKLIIEGDARNIDILKQAGVDSADHFLVLTSNEVKNIEINCKVKEQNPRIKTALLIKNLNYSEIVKSRFAADKLFHIPSIVSYPIALSCINHNILFSFKDYKSNYYLGHINLAEYPELQKKELSEIETNYKVKIIKHQQSSSSTDSSVFGSEDSFVYLSDNKNCFEKQFHDSRSNVSNVIPEISKEITRGLRLSNGLKKVIAAYSLLILVSVLLFKFSLHISIIDAAYFVITTTTTVGYGDINLMNSSFWVKLYGCFLMLSGAALLATLFGVITDNVISKRLGRYINYYNRNIKNHVIVAGIGSIGFGVVNYLTKMGIKIIVIEKNPENPNIYSLRKRIPVLIGDASDSRILSKANIKKAKALASLIDEDLNNINIIVKGNHLNNNLHTVVRIFSSNFYNKVNGSAEFDNIISASAIAAPYIVCGLIHNDILWAGRIHGKLFSLFKIETSLFYSFKSLKNFSYSVVMTQKDGKSIYPDNEMNIEESDYLFIFGEYKFLEKMKG